MARATVTGIDPIEFAHDQGRLLTQILLWMLSGMAPDERRPFLEGVFSVATMHAAELPAPATTPARRKGRG
jgi:hypothetical protein